ncbi:hypothetical protein C5167_040288, partial [Papaver somniferum]
MKSVSAADTSIQLYLNFITEFETEINFLKLAHFAKLRATGETRIEESILYINMRIAAYRFETGERKECQNLFDDRKTILDSMTDIDLSLYGSNYSLLFIVRHVKNSSKRRNTYRGTRCLYHNLITEFETKINLLKLVHFAVIVSRQYAEKEATICYLEGVIEKLHATRETRIEESIFYINMRIAAFRLEMGEQIYLISRTRCCSQGCFEHSTCCINEKKLLEKIYILRLMEIIFGPTADDQTIPLGVIAQHTASSHEELI